MAEQQHSDLLQEKQPLIVIASNRGPYSFKQKEDGEFTAERGVGGLVTALFSLAEQHQVIWVACAMAEDDRAWVQAQQGQTTAVGEMRLKLLTPDPEAYNQYYNVIANPLLWFIQHQLWDATRTPSITSQTWQAWDEGFVSINRQFAEGIAEAIKHENPAPNQPVIVLPQDYHLYLVPHFLRQLLGERVQIQPFIHIPWPGPDAWRILPQQMRGALLESMLEADRVGFQTEKDAFNFVQTCRFYLTDAHSHGSRDTITFHGKRVKAHVYPISIDINAIQEMITQPETRLLKQQIINIIGDRKVVLRVDRIEPSKNILRGLEAYQALLETYPEHLGRVQMLALLVPSRMGVEEYMTYWQEVMGLAGLINATHSDALWEPVRIIVGNNYARALAAMQVYDVLLVNPLADGMNLVAKEGALVNRRDGVLVLSEFAGAYYEMGEHALSVSPFDVYGTAKSIHQALTMPSAERARRAEALRQAVSGSQVSDWFYTQVVDALSAAASQPSNSEAPAGPSTVKSDSAATAGGASAASTATA